MRHAWAVIFSSLVLVAGAARAADAVTLAAQQEAEERYRRLGATMEEIQILQAAQRKEIDSLRSELSKLREEIARNNNSAATQESIRELNNQIRKVDESRVADNKHLQDAIEQLGQAIKKGLSAPPPRPRAGNTDSGNTGGPSGNGPGNAGPTAKSGNPDELGIWYTIQSGDNHLGVIVKRYSDEKITVTKKAIMDANPTVDWTKLKIGQKIFIPKPK